MIYEVEYKDNEELLYKTKCKLGLPNKELEEVDCFVTEGHIIIQGRELTKIPMIRLKSCNVWRPWFSMPNPEYIPENITGALELTFLDESNVKQKLRLEIGADPHYFEQIVNAQRDRVTPKNRSQPDPGEEVAKTSLMVIGASLVLWLMLQGMEGEGTQHLWMLGFATALGAGLGIWVALPWALRVSSWKRFMTFIAAGLLCAVLWGLVAYDMFMAPLAAILTAALLGLMRLRMLGVIQFPW